MLEVKKDIVKEIIPCELEKVQYISALYTLLGDIMMDKPKDTLLDQVKQMILNAQGLK